MANVFEFLSGSKRVDKQIGNFISESNKLSEEEFLKQLISFLQGANQAAIERLKSLNYMFFLDDNSLLGQFPVKLNKRIILSKLTGDLDRLYDSLQQNKGLAEFLNHHIANLRVGEVPDIKACAEKYESVKRESEALPPVSYHVLFLDGYDGKRFHPESFQSFADAKEFVSKQEKSTLMPLYHYVVEIQSQDSTAATKAISDLKYFRTDRSENKKWPHQEINSITEVGIRQEFGGVGPTEYLLTDKDGKRNYNPKGKDSVARTVKQLDAIITRLESYWVLTLILEALHVYEPGLTQKKIQAVQELKNNVIECKEKIEAKPDSLKEVLNEGLNKEYASETIKYLLHKQRCSFFEQKTKADGEIEELQGSIKPPMS